MKACGRCGFWGGNGERLERDDPNLLGQKVELGSCRRSAPQVVTRQLEGAYEELRLQTVWPTTGSDDWCGEWIPDYG